MKTYDYILKKYNITVGRQYIIEISDMGRDNLAELFAELKFKKGVEIGVDRGQYSEVLCKANPKAQIFSVDPWRSEAYEPGGWVDEEQKFFDDIRKQAEEKLAPYKNCTIVPKTSVEAMKDFKDDSVDFVYIDGNHDFPSVIQDLHGWKKKLRPGGILSGHDYAYFTPSKFNHVKKALESYTRSYRMIPFFVAGSFNVVEGEVRDKYRSWFWVKQ